ncbi:uncharacterized protein LOC115085334 isoform X2 [Rhinatrema bivittatum]|uniref:uncharacterized protein LOC115085334 isoform X2 n=1 Tax=Rhinatrema bivittatum TaxID=194408 RepID=UPI001127F870|nr:uncharacterized protein LOC115085334 isoform X2 [Rhinatrema bivittatum]
MLLILRNPNNMAPIRRDRGHAKKVSSQQISHGASMPDGAPMPDASASNDAVARTPRRSRSPRRSPNAERQPPTSTQRRGNRATSVTPPDNADIEHLVNEIRAQAMTHGTEWVRQHMATFNSSTTHNAPKRVHAASKKKVPSKKVPSQRSSKSSAGQSSGPTAPSTASASTRSQRGASTRTERNSRSLHTSSRATNTSGADNIPMPCPDSRPASNPHTRGGMATWPPGFWDLILQSLSENTRRSYKQAWLDFHNFRTNEMQETAEWPISPYSLSRYILHCKNLGKSRALVANCLAGISFFSRLLGFPGYTSMFPIRRAMLGWQRGVGITADSRRPITVQILRKIVQALDSVCSDDTECTLFRCAFSLAFYAALSVSELTAQSTNRSSASCLQWQDTVLERDRLILRIPRSKTDQRGIGSNIILHQWAGELTCPIGSTTLFLRQRPPIVGQLLIHKNGRPLTRYQFSRVLHMSLHAAGIAVSGFSTHSFRIGAATTAASLGLQDEKIMAIGRWRSGRFSRYVRPQQYFANNM